MLHGSTDAVSKRGRAAIAFCLAIAVLLAFAAFWIPSSSQDVDQAKAVEVGPEIKLFLWVGYSTSDPAGAISAIGLGEVNMGHPTALSPSAELTRVWATCGLEGEEAESMEFTKTRITLCEEGVRECFMPIDGVRIDMSSSVSTRWLQASRFDLALYMEEDDEPVVFSCQGIEVDVHNPFFESIISRPPDESVPEFSLDDMQLSLDFTYPTAVIGTLLIAFLLAP